jgi:2-polyprenyl-3-methyl-5-hydroxy-6-metoxy-1,4-benzoquinol methylase
MERRDHWEKVYNTKAPDKVSWYRPHLETSFGLIDRVCRVRKCAVIDVGGGEATLVDDLVEAGYQDVTVLDLSEKALRVARERLGSRAARVTWIQGDITQSRLEPARYDVWHDRAVFHFLTSAAERQRYIAQVAWSVRPGGYVIVATFGPQGPEMCSGLPVARYDAQSLHHQFGAKFQLVDSSTEMHATPFGTEQQFVYCMCRIETA